MIIIRINPALRDREFKAADERTLRINRLYHLLVVDARYLYSYVYSQPIFIVTVLGLSFNVLKYLMLLYSWGKAADIPVKFPSAKVPQWQQTLVYAV